jgi:tetratricopeptide (TPR) repeat protein
LAGQWVRRATSSVLSAWLVLSPAVLAGNEEAREQAIALAVDGQYEEALRIFQRLLHDSPENPLLNYYAGAACVRTNRVGEGMGYLERAVRYEAQFPQAYLELSEAYLKRKLKAEALKVASRGLEQFPENERLRSLVRRIERAEQ